MRFFGVAFAGPESAKEVEGKKGRRRREQTSLEEGA